MNEVMNIYGTDIQIREWMGKRVVTFKDIDKLHHRPDGTARKRFNDNKKHFVSGVDFFKVCASEIRTHKIMELSSKAHEDVTLITETGYLMLVKSFTDDLAWKVQRELVDSYFKAREIIMESEEVQGFKTAVLNTDQVIRISDIMGRCLDGNRPYVLNILRHLIPDIDEIMTDDGGEQTQDASMKVAVKPSVKSMRAGYSKPFNNRKFNDYLYENNISSTELEEMLGCSSGCVSKWRSGNTNPGGYYRVRSVRFWEYRKGILTSV